MAKKDRESTDGKQSVAIGGASAVTRSLLGQFLATFFRVPVKLFRPTRVDYMIIPRAIGPRPDKGASWSWRTSSPMLLASAVRQHGFSFLPTYVLPPLLCNSVLGVVLYTTYIESLALLQDSSDDSVHRSIPFETTYKAGAIAGLAQATISQPIDALTVRFEVNKMLEGKYRSMWHYGFETLRDAGFRPVFGGFLLSAAKESLSMGAFFATFEFVKNQGYYSFLRLVYGRSHLSLYKKDYPDNQQLQRQPFWLIGPSFLLLSGLCASLAHSSMHFPLSKIQEIHLARLESMDYRIRYEQKFKTRAAISIYASEYWKTAKQCSFVAAKNGGWRRWLFKNIATTAIRSAPATSFGLVVFESFRSHFSGSSVGADIFLEA